MGATPYSWLLAKLVVGVDLRTVGSGNPGATNLYRTAGLAWGLCGLMLDVAKGAAAVLAAKWIAPGVVALPVVAAAAAIGGHIWTPFLRFRGGKGVATTAGAFLALAPLIVGVAVAVFFIGVALSRYVSLGSVAAAAAGSVASVVVPLLRGERVDPYFVGLCVAAAVGIIYAHRKNIARMVAGTESKLGAPKRNDG